MATPQGTGRPHDQPDDQYQQDLNPNPRAGVNYGREGEQPNRFSRTAADVPDLRTQMSDDYSDEDLERIPVLQGGTRLKQGATYISLADPTRKEFTGMANQSVDENDYIVPKSQVGHGLWNRLIGVENPTRLPG